MLLVIEHDNNQGLRGFSDYVVSSEKEAKSIIDEMIKKGIIIYNWYITNI